MIMPTRVSTTQRALGAVAALVVSLGAAMPAPAQQVQFQFSQRETWVGSPSVLTITVKDADAISDPVLPKVDGLEFMLQPGRSTMSSMQFVNGAMTRDNSTTLTVLVTPVKAGVFSIPPISITVDGANHASQPTTISSVPSTTGDLLKVEVISEPTEAWIGQPVRAVLRIMVKPYRNSQHRVTLDEADMWQFIDAQRCEFGPFQNAMAELRQRGQRPMGHEELVGSSSYLTYEVSTAYIPSAPGIPSFGDIRVAWNYPARVDESRGFFGRPELSVSATKPISAVAATRDFVVRALPEEGRPASFSGAIGDFAINASAKPTRVGVGDPITLSLTVTDRGDGASLAQVQPPRLDTPELERDFRMPTAPLAGTVAGLTKSFTQTLRPVRQGVEQIPAIEFSWFDPTRGQYARARTAPIPIEVVASEHISTRSILAGSDAAPSAAPLEGAAGGLLANIAPSDAMVAGARWQFVSPAMLMSIGGLPAVIAAILFVKRRRDRLSSDMAYARARGARSGARRHLQAGDASAALTSFIADHANRPHGTLTRADVRAILRASGATDALAARIDAQLAIADTRRFAAAGSAPSARADADSIEAILDELGELRWADSRTPHRGDRP